MGSASGGPGAQPPSLALPPPAGTAGSSPASAVADLGSRHPQPQGHRGLTFQPTLAGMPMSCMGAGLGRALNTIQLPFSKLQAVGGRGEGCLLAAC